MNTNNSGFQPNNKLQQFVNYKCRSENRYILHPQNKRRCKTCKIVKAFDDFPIKRRKSKTCRLDSQCKLCNNQRHADIRAKQRNDPQKYCMKMIAQLRHRSKMAKIPFNLTANDLYQIWIKQDGFCYYTGEPMDFQATTANRLCPHNNYPSIDKLRPKLGYITGNIVWCKYVVNRMKGNLTEEEFYGFCNQTLKYRKIPA